MKALIIILIVLAALFVLTFCIYFFNLDMKLVRKIYDQRPVKDVHQPGLEDTDSGDFRYDRNLSWLLPLGPDLSLIHI